MRFAFNPFFRAGVVAPSGGTRDVLAFHRSLPGYEPTPLHSLPTAARALGVGTLLVKDESRRFGIKAFKALGASWALHTLVEERVCGPAGMGDSGYFRSDELPERTAMGYLSAEGHRTNVFHLPVRANGDGGMYTTAADVSAFWPALFAGRIVSTDLVAEMVRPHSDVPGDSMRYGLGFWLNRSTGAVQLEGYDAGVSFRSVHHPGTGLTHTVIGNSSGGAWPVARRLAELLA